VDTFSVSLLLPLEENSDSITTSPPPLMLLVSDLFVSFFAAFRSTPLFLLQIKLLVLIW
jgi:hypothetical protein